MVLITEGNNILPRIDVMCERLAVPKENVQCGKSFLGVKMVKPVFFLAYFTLFCFS